MDDIHLFIFQTSVNLLNTLSPAFLFFKLTSSVSDTVCTGKILSMTVFFRAETRSNIELNCIIRLCRG